MLWAVAVHCTQIFAREDLWSQLAKEGRSLGSLCLCPCTSLEVAPWKALPAPGGLLQALLSLSQSLCPASLVPGALVQAQQCVNCWVQQGMCCLPWSWGLFLQVAFTFRLGGVQLCSPMAPGAHASWRLWVLGLGWGGSSHASPVVTSQVCSQRMLLSSVSLFPTMPKNLVGIHPIGFI